MEHIVLDYLPFNYIESESRKRFCALLNKKSVNLMVTGDAVTGSVVRRYFITSKKMESYLTTLEAKYVWRWTSLWTWTGYGPEVHPSVGPQESSRSQIQGPLLNNQPFWTGNIYERTQLPNGTAEAGRYFLEAQTGETVDPIEFWKAHHKAYPCLSQVVRTVMAAPVTSTPPERAFSKTSLIFQHAIGSLSAQQLYVLISWLKNGR